MRSSESPTWILQPAATRFLTEAPGRATRHAFSFGTHYDPANVGFGPLLASNDDRLGAGCGYGPHQHRDTEIVTWVVAGALRHTDSAGRTAVVSAGLVQRMSAGGGIVHSEGNDAPAPGPGRAPVPVRFIQMWLRPDEPGGEPDYQCARVDLPALERGWVAVASGDRGRAAVPLRAAGATLWATRLERGGRRTLPRAEWVFVQLVSGVVDLAGVGRVGAGDTVRLEGAPDLLLTGVHAAEVLVWTFRRNAATAVPLDGGLAEGGQG